MDSIFYPINGNANAIPVMRYSWYPAIAVTQKNEEYAAMLTMDLAYAQSEMTTVHQYLYQSWNIGEDYETVKIVVTRIAQVEIHHFNIIGKLITLLGGRASCRAVQNNTPLIWNGSMVNYSVNIKEMLKSNMEGEKGAAQSYLEQSKTIKDPLVSKMLFRLSQDEQLHYNIFKSFLSQV